MVRYPPAETADKHKKILDQASRLFRERGLSGVTVGDLMKAADLTHGAFYNHFDSKQALIGECVTHLTGNAVQRIGTYAPTVEGKQNFAATYAGLKARDDPGHYCLMSSLSPEIAREPAARTAMTGYVLAFVGKLVSHFPWPRPADARRDAIRMTAALVGAVALARAVEDEGLSAEILQEVASQFSQEGDRRRGRRPRRRIRTINPGMTEN